MVEKVSESKIGKFSIRHRSPKHYHSSHFGIYDQELAQNSPKVIVLYWNVWIIYGNDYIFIRCDVKSKCILNKGC